MVSRIRTHQLLYDDAVSLDCLLSRLASGMGKQVKCRHLTPYKHQAALPSSWLACNCLDCSDIILAQCSNLIQNLSLTLALLLSKVDGEIDTNG
jgi:hypothetical protein